MVLLLFKYLVSAWTCCRALRSRGDYACIPLDVDPGSLPGEPSRTPGPAAGAAPESAAPSKTIKKHLVIQSNRDRPPKPSDSSTSAGSSSSERPTARGG